MPIMARKIGIIGRIGEPVTSEMIRSVCKSDTPIIDEINMDKVHNIIENDLLIFLNDCNSIDFNDMIKMYIKDISGNKVFVVNSDNKLLMDLISVNNLIPVITVGLNGKSTITASSMEYSIKKTKFLFCLQRNIKTLDNKIIEPFEYPFEIRALGQVQIYNSLFVIAVLILLGIDINIIQKALKHLVIKRNMQLIYDRKFSIIDSKCTDIQSYENTLESLQLIEYNNLVIVCQLTNDITYNEKVHKLITNWATILSIKKVIYTLYDKLTYNNNYNDTETDMYLSDVFDALEHAINISSENDIITILGGDQFDQANKIIFELMYNKLS